MAPAVGPVGAVDSTGAVPDAVAPPRGNPRFPLLDGTRAIAALLVVGTHAGSISTFSETNEIGGLTARMNVGVTLFFVLSGFLLYRPYVAARMQGRPAIRLGPYLWRRALRIVPAYWVALTLLALWPGLVGFWEGDWWKAYLFLTVYSKDTFFLGIEPAWSLCVEVTFYLLLPLIAAAIGRVAGRSVRIELAVLGALALASVVARGLVPLDGMIHNTILCTFAWFAAGMACATVSVAAEGREARSRPLAFVARRPGVLWAAAGVVFLIAAYPLDLPRGMAFPDTRAQFLAEHVLYLVIAVLVLAPAVFGGASGGLPRRLLAHRVAGWMGLISYGLFLWHMPLMRWLSREGADTWLPGSGVVWLTLFTLALAIPAAAASYYLVERPLLRLKGRGSSASTRRRAEVASAPEAAAATARHATELSGSAAAASRASSSA
ncbi:MAG TPA: acyltransferase [Solirubrobacteraceae bacterium]|nr:acyltransferase [Solirubrobacteraceae bacterium]